MPWKSTAYVKVYVREAGGLCAVILSFPEVTIRLDFYRMNSYSPTLFSASSTSFLNEVPYYLSD
jgi:hypothetical protein